MPNTQTSVPLYAPGEVLTAANLNLTNSGIPVFATTVTRDAAFGGANEKVLAEGQFAYIEATNTTQYYDGANWQAVGASSGLVLISATTIGTTVSSVAVSSAFSALYDSYFITVSGGVSSAQSLLTMIFTGSTASYYRATVGLTYSTGSSSNSVQNNAASFDDVGTCRSDGLFAAITLTNPFLAKTTYGSCGSGNSTNTIGKLTFLYHDLATSYSGFTISPSSGTLTGGTIRVYGYAAS
jgi:hypothetical protein